MTTFEFIGSPRNSSIDVQVFFRGDLIADGTINLAQWDALRNTVAVDEDEMIVWSATEKYEQEGSS